MDYTPRYSQPFTLEQARLLDVPIIVEGHALSVSSITILPESCHQRSLGYRTR